VPLEAWRRKTIYQPPTPASRRTSCRPERVDHETCRGRANSCTSSHGFTREVGVAPDRARAPEGAAHPTSRARRPAGLIGSIIQRALIVPVAVDVGRPRAGPPTTTSVARAQHLDRDPNRSLSLRSGDDILARPLQRPPPPGESRWSRYDNSGLTIVGPEQARHVLRAADTLPIASQPAWLAVEAVERSSPQFRIRGRAERLGDQDALLRTTR